MARLPCTDMDTQFLKACETGNLNELLNILYYHDNGAVKLLKTDPWTLDHMHYFHAVCLNGHNDIVEQLFYFDVDVNLDSPYGTPLAVACQGGHIETVKLLVKHGAKMYDRDANPSLTPFFLACKHGHLDILTFLVNEEPEALLKLGPLLLVEACHEGFLDIVILLVSKHIDINCEVQAEGSDSLMSRSFSFEESLKRPLEAACSQHQVEVVEYLLQEQVNVTDHIVQKYYQVLGEAVCRNFKEHLGKYKKHQEGKSLLEGDFSFTNFHNIHKSWFADFADQLVLLDLSNNNLRSIPKEVLNLSALKEINLEANRLYELPEVDNVEDSRLVVIKASSNSLKHVPLSFFNIKGLCHLNLVKNNIISLLNDDVTAQFYIDDVMNDDITWQCHSLKSLNLARNQLVSIPSRIHAANSLEKLVLFANKLTSFPKGWKCPLRILNLSQNQLTDVNFQESVFHTWTQTLVDLNLSYNNLTSISWDICQLQSLQCLDLSHNAIEYMPAKIWWKCSNLRRFILANNKLCGISQRIQSMSPGSRLSRHFSIGSRSPTEERFDIEDEFPYELFGATLEMLDLSCNNLVAVPSSVCKLTSLEELNLSWNRNLKTLPPELGNLTECYQLGLEGLRLTGIPKYARASQHSTSKDVLTFLRAKQRKAVAYYRMKLMVIGLQGRGKTTLLAALRNRPLPPNISTVGIVVNEWTYSGSQSLLGKVVLLGKKEQSNPSITFSTWDLAGQQIYYSTHQCFLSSNTLYLAVWNVSHGVEGVDKLKPWLLNVQARAPGSHVIVVGTHIDLLPEAGKARLICELKLSIVKRYSKKGFPNIKGYCMVSCTTGENMAELRQVIYRAALDLKESESAGKGESLIGRKIPLSYLKLQENVIKEAENRKKDNKPPILNEEQMLELAKQDSNNDILERDELILAARFLHENGVILHYNDRSRGLDKLYFIEPGWLCEIMALLVTVKETNAFVKGGIIDRSNVNLLLRNPRLPPQFMEQYIQLMERFEVALTLDEHRLLVPSMLPRDKPGLHLADLSKMLSRTGGALAPVLEESKASNEDLTKRKKVFSVLGIPPDTFVHDSKPYNSSEYLRRLYKMNYVPSGFWSRLIARLMIAVQRWGTEEGLGDEMICDEEGKTVRSTSNFRPVPHGYSMIYWREGMGVVYEGGHLMVESHSEMERNAHTGTLEDIEGVMVTVWSAQKDFSVLGFVTDQVNSLISEWYPGLEESDKYGIPLVRHVIPCPICAVHKVPTFRLRRSLSMRNMDEIEETKPPEFSLIECAAAAVDYTEIACPKHEDIPVKLSSLVPDLLLSDLPPELVIDNKVFVFNPSEENRLGSGGAGEVFSAMYRKQKVAVKRFYSSNAATGTDSGLGLTTRLVCPANRGATRHTDGGSFASRAQVFTARPTTIEEDLERTKILSSFRELRQEVSVLGRLNHPCVVALVGVSIRPLCIVLELAPMGSLYSILEKEAMKLESEKFQQNARAANDVRKPIFGRNLTYKIVYQVVHALQYLHYLGIVYRDLKSDNLLVWSLEKDALVHVKLSDYGISRFATPQGMLGEEGTPGFQAPEVRTGSTYNEKVDIFSLAMLIYEILSGLRPFHECRCTAQIKKALRRGERPSLERSYVDTEMPELEALMVKCWRESAASRPSAEAVLGLLEDPSFLCLNRAMPYIDQEIWKSITAFISLSNEDQLLTETEPAKGSHSVLLWGGEDDERCFSVIDCKTGLDQVPKTPCLGPRVACLARVGDRYWLGTEGSVIEVFGRAQFGSDLSVLWSIKVNAQVLGMEVEQYINRRSINLPSDRVRRIFACLANGSVVVISRSDLRQPSSLTCSLQFKSDSNEKVRQEASMFSVMTSIQIGEAGLSACCLLFVNDGKELWVGCGNYVGIIDPDSLEVVHKFRAYVSPRSNVRAMVTDGPTVFTINRKTPDVFQWSVETRQRICKFYIDQENPRGLNVAREVTSKRDDDVTVENDDDIDKIGDVTDNVIGDDDGRGGFNMEPQEGTSSGSTSDPQMYIDVEENPVSRIMKQPSLMRSFKRSGSRNSRKKHGVVRDSTPDSGNRSDQIRSRTHVISNTERRITCALVVDGNLWLGRETGDIVVVNISGKQVNVDEEQGSGEFGFVHAVLTLGVEHGYVIKGIHGILRVGCDKVASFCRVLREKSSSVLRSITAPLLPKTQRSFLNTKSPHFPFFSSHPNTAVEQPAKRQEARIEKYQMCVWERWRSEDFKEFYNYHENLDKA